MSSPIEEIKSRLDIAELIQSYVRLHKSGINYKANCPFHSEKTPSFFVSPARQIWHCFGCGKGGDHFKFIMEIEGQDFPEALRLLATRAGVVLKREDPAIRSERNRLYDICEETSNIFERSLALTPAAKKYLVKRGLKDETIKEFRVGFAPQSWDFLLKALAAKGFKKDEVEKAGLAVKSEDKDSWYDRFRSRITFPISDANGRVIGFSGRIFDAADSRGLQRGPTQTEAKYVNTPNTLIYDKSRAIYGFDKAKQEIRAKNRVVVVEGQMDCVMSHQAGVKNAIAVSGTALTPQHLKVLRRLCDTFVCSFDTDTAGDTATKRSLALASEFEFDRKIAVISSGKDPADMVLESPKAWLESVEGAKPVVEFYFEKAFRENNPEGVQGKKAISSLLLPFLADISNDIERSHWVSELSQKLGVKEEAVTAELKKAKSQKGYDHRLPEQSEPAKIPTRRDLLEERMLALFAIIDEEQKKAFFSRERYLFFTSSLNQKLFDAFRAPNQAVTADLKSQFELLRFKGEVISQITKDINEEFLACGYELERECIKERLLKLGEEIERKEKAGEHAAVASLLSDFKSFSEKLKFYGKA